MPSKRKAASPAGAAPELNVPKELLDQLVSGPMTQGDLESMFRSLKKAVIERAMTAEMTQHLGYAPGDSRPEGQRNHRNGASAKTVITDDGPVRIDVPRDREGSFEPQLIGKHARRFTGFDQKIVAMYARGMTVREIQGYLLEMYGTEVSPEFISKVTDEVMAEVVAWQSRPLGPMYPVVFFDALRVKIRDDAVVRNQLVPPDSRTVEGYGHELRALLDAARAVCAARSVTALDGFQADSLPIEILGFLDDFAHPGGRYSNINKLTGHKHQAMADPIARWGGIASQIMQTQATPRERERARMNGRMASIAFGAI